MAPGALLANKVDKIIEEPKAGRISPLLPWLQNRHGRAGLRAGAPVAFCSPLDKRPGTGAPGMNNKKPGLSEVLQMHQAVEKLIMAVFAGREQKKGDRNKWRGKARRLLRKISESI